MSDPSESAASEPRSDLHIALYSARGGELIDRVLAKRFRVTRLAVFDADVFEKTGEGCGGIVCHLPPDPGTDVLDALERVTRVPGALPVVVYASFDAAGVKRLSRIVMQELVWEHEGPEALVDAIRRTCSGFLSRPLRSLRNQPLPEELRRMLRAALSLPFPESVEELSRRSYMAPTTLRARWRRHAGRLTPKDFLDRVCLVRAYERRAGGESWTKVAKSFEVGVRTLQRRCERCCSRSLDELSDSDVSALVRELSEHIRALGESNRKSL